MHGLQSQRLVRRRIKFHIAWLPVLLLIPGFYVFTPEYVVQHDIWLSGNVAVAAWFVSATGSVYGIPWIAAVLIWWKVRADPRGKRAQVRGFLYMSVLLLVVVGGGSYLNEHVVKPGIHQPRPNIMQLGSVPPGAPILGMSADRFYALPNNGERSEILASALNDWDKTFKPLHPLVRSHWIDETGFSLPSGHAFAAMAIASFFTLVYFAGNGRAGRKVCCFLVSWAVLVCYSRLLLGVHTPLDVLLGTVEGILAGSIAYIIFHRIWTAEDV